VPASNSDARKRLEELARTGLDNALSAGVDTTEAAQQFVDRINAARAMKTTIIGLSGWAQSGKDSTGAVLAEVFGFTKLAFAEKLRAVARAANPVVNVTTDATFIPGTGSLRYEFGLMAENFYRQDPDNAYEWLKANTSYRQFLQDLGTAVREHLGQTTWVDAVFNEVEDGGKYVITDVRFQNEAQAIKDRGGQVWRISREGHQPPNDHISERDLDEWDFDKRLSLPDFGDDLDALYPAIKRLVGITFGVQVP